MLLETPLVGTLLPSSECIMHRNFGPTTDTETGISNVIGARLQLVDELSCIVSIPLLTVLD